MSRHPRWQRLLCALFFLGSASLLSIQAQAQELGSIQVEQFETLPDQRTNVLNVAGSTVLQHLTPSVGALIQYVASPLRAVPVGSVDFTPRDVVEYQVKSDLWLALGLFDWVDIGVVLPVVFAQSGGEAERIGVSSAIEGASLGDLRIVPRVTLLPREWAAGFGIALAAPLTLPTGDEGSYNGEGSVRVEPRLIVDYVHDIGFAIAANFGYLVREEQRIHNIVNDDVLRWSAAVLVPLGVDGLQAMGTVFGAIQLSDGLSADLGAAADDWNSSPIEALGGIRYISSFGLETSLAAGRGLNTAVGAPELRILASVGYFYHDDDYDDDGILNDDDACPNEPEDVDGFEDENGCPDPDNDQDGILDGADECPEVPEDPDGFADQDGCPDVDNDDDGLIDVIDGCPDEPEDFDGFVDDDGCADADNDQDGFCDLWVLEKGLEAQYGCQGADKCPDVPEDVDGFEDTDGCPEPDNDRDGFCDAWVVEKGLEAQSGCRGVDACPNEPETINAFEDEDGCPDVGETKVVVTDTMIEILDMVYFDTNKATIKAISFPILDQVYAVLRANPQVTKVRVEGHTDSDGSASKNLKLSQDRAAAVVQYLVDKGIEPSRLSSEGYGEDKPIDSNKTKQGKAKNRRVEFRILEASGKTIEPPY
ncbi:MAG: OmpA family protein [Myxococcota bacterium]|jgi:outer membrane protein OmpA-like peptidoglycan-associated protein|nr:OmpA family protein [Myxococcota bacterium]